MVDAMAVPGNPSSLHGWGRRTRAMIEHARRGLAERLAVAPDRVIFTSGGTEANHLALIGTGGDWLVSAIEHASIREAVSAPAMIPVDDQGRIDLAGLQELLRQHRPRLVSVMLANNETGVIQPVAQVADLVHAHGSLLHCDAVQAFGKLPCALTDLGADLLTLSAHKLGGPPGVGALVVREGLDPRPLQQGGGQERRRRAGTENVPGIVGFGAALAVTTDWVAVRQLQERLERLVRSVRPDAVVAGGDADRLPNITCLVTPGLPAETQLMALDLAGVAVSSGAACSSGKVGPSHVLAAMGLPLDLAHCAIRVSLGWTTTLAQVHRFVDAWTGLQARRHTVRNMAGQAAKPAAVP